MQKWLWQLTMVGAIVGLWLLGGYLDGLYLHWRLHPTPSPDQAPLPVAVYPGASVAAYGVSETSTGDVYYWDLDSPWPTPQVVAWYQKQLSANPTALDTSRSLFKWTPSGGGDGDLAQATISPHGDGTLIHLTESHAETNQLTPGMRTGLIRLGLMVFFFGLCSMYRDRFVSHLIERGRTVTLRIDDSGLTATSDDDF